MRPRTIRISVSVLGMSTTIATASITKFASVLEADTDLVCPECGKKPTWAGGYNCPCGQTFKHWSKLKRVTRSGEEVVKEKFTEAGKDVEASLSIMPLEQWRDIVDGTADEYGLVTKDETSARNLKKLLIASQKLDKVVIVKFKDTYEERIAVLTTSISGRVILREIIPLNLADIGETMRVNLTDLTEKDIAEAQTFVGMIPPAIKADLEVSDYRTKGVSREKVSEKAVELEAIIDSINIAH